MGAGPRGPGGCRPPTPSVSSRKRRDILGGALTRDPAPHQAGAFCVPLTAGEPSRPGWGLGRPVNSRGCPFPWSPGRSPWDPKAPRRGGTAAAARRLASPPARTAQLGGAAGLSCSGCAQSPAPPGSAPGRRACARRAALQRRSYEQKR